MLPFIENSPDITSAIEYNRDMALNYALFMHYRELKPVHLMDLYTTLCSMSYKGDIRMKMKMENPNKVKNIVLGSYDGLNSIYQPRLDALNNQGLISKVNDDEWQVNILS